MVSCCDCGPLGGADRNGRGGRISGPVRAVPGGRFRQFPASRKAGHGTGRRLARWSVAATEQEAFMHIRTYIFAALGATALTLGPGIPGVQNVSATSAYALGTGGGAAGAGVGGGVGAGTSGGAGVGAAANGGTVGVSAHGTASASAHSAASAHSGRGLSAAELQGLNAYHANPEAFAHANPHSEIGKLAAYRKSAVAVETAKAKLAKTKQSLVEVERDVKTTKSRIGALKHQQNLTEAQKSRLAALQDRLTKEQRALKAKRTSYNAALRAKQSTAAREKTALHTLTKGQTLSAQATATLNQRLGL